MTSNAVSFRAAKSSRSSLAVELFDSLVSTLMQRRWERQAGERYAARINRAEELAHARHMASRAQYAVSRQEPVVRPRRAAVTRELINS